jgi:hypothetical protein
MSMLKYFFPVLLFSVLAVPGRCEDPASSTEKAPDPRTEKPARRLKGEFKGHPIAVSPESGKSESPKPAARKQPPDK